MEGRHAPKFGRQFPRGEHIGGGGQSARHFGGREGAFFEAGQEPRAWKVEGGAAFLRTFGGGALSFYTRAACPAGVLILRKKCTR